MKTRVLLLGCLLGIASHAQFAAARDLWMWKDANGVTHYSDVPGPGARKVTIAGETPVDAAAPPTPAITPAGPARSESRSAVEYSVLEIVAPEQDASFFGSDAVVEVSVRSQPSLASNDRLVLYLDGELLEGENAYDRTFENLERGSHSIMGVILDATGQEKIRSEPRVFHIKQNTLSNPRNVGPSLKPKPPKPQPRN